MNRTMITLLAAGALVTGLGVAGTAAADEPAARTPKRTPMVSTPDIRTPFVATPHVETPAQRVSAEVDAIDLPTRATVGTDGAVAKDTSTPGSTPDVQAAPVVPAIEVEAIEVAPIHVEEIPVQVQLPLAAEASTDGAAVETSLLDVSADVFGDDLATVDAGAVRVTADLEG